MTLLLCVVSLCLIKSLAESKTHSVQLKVLPKPIVIIIKKLVFIEYNLVIRIFQNIVSNHSKSSYKRTHQTQGHGIKAKASG